MKKKPVAKPDESDGSDAVDEPDEVSEDEGATKRRSSGRLRSTKKAKLAEPSSSEGEEDEEGDEEEAEDEEDDDEEESADSEEEYNKDQGKKRGRGRPPIARGRYTKRNGAGKTDDAADADDLQLSSLEDYCSGSYVVLKTDFAVGGDPPIWKIDGKALLQKYIPFTEDGKTLYRNTSTYSGWSTGNKDNYHPAPIVYKVQNRKETVVEFLRDSIKIDQIAAPVAVAANDDPPATEQ